MGQTNLSCQKEKLNHKSIHNFKSRILNNNLDDSKIIQMGQVQSATLMRFRKMGQGSINSLNDKFYLVKRINFSEQSEFISLRRYFQKQSLSSSSSSSSLSTVPTDLTKIIKVNQQIEKGLCSNNFSLKIWFQYSDITLKDELQIRIHNKPLNFNLNLNENSPITNSDPITNPVNNSFSYSDLCSILFTCLNALVQCQRLKKQFFKTIQSSSTITNSTHSNENSTNHPNSQHSTSSLALLQTAPSFSLDRIIIMPTDGSLKVIHPIVINQEDRYCYRQDTLYSPQKMKDFLIQDGQKGSIFQIGLVLLQCILRQSTEQFKRTVYNGYSYNSNSIKEKIQKQQQHMMKQTQITQATQIAQTTIEKISQTTTTTKVTSLLLFTLINQMLSEFPQDRPSLSECVEYAEKMIKQQPNQTQKVHVKRNQKQIIDNGYIHVPSARIIQSVQQGYSYQEQYKQQHCHNNNNQNHNNYKQYQMSSRQTLTPSLSKNLTQQPCSSQNIAIFSTNSLRQGINKSYTNNDKLLKSQQETTAQKPSSFSSSISPSFKLKRNEGGNCGERYGEHDCQNSVKHFTYFDQLNATKDKINKNNNNIKQQLSQTQMIYSQKIVPYSSTCWHSTQLSQPQLSYLSIQTKTNNNTSNNNNNNDYDDYIPNNNKIKLPHFGLAPHQNQQQQQQQQFQISSFDQILKNDYYDQDSNNGYSHKQNQWSYQHEECNPNNINNQQIKRTANTDYQFDSFVYHKKMFQPKELNPKQNQYQRNQQQQSSSSSSNKKHYRNKSFLTVTNNSNRKNNKADNDYKSKDSSRRPSSYLCQQSSVFSSISFANPIKTTDSKAVIALDNKKKHVVLSKYRKLLGSRTSRQTMRNLTVTSNLTARQSEEESINANANKQSQLSPNQQDDDHPLSKLGQKVGFDDLSLKKSIFITGQKGNLKSFQQNQTPGDFQSEVIEKIIIRNNQNQQNPICFPGEKLRF